MDRKEAIRRIRAWNLDSDDMELLTEVIPELKESEDDKIVDATRKALKTKIEDLGNGVTRTACLAWLEKQNTVSEDLDEAALQYAKDYLFTPAAKRDLRDHFVAGAQWQREQMKEVLQTEYEKGRAEATMD